MINDKYLFIYTQCMIRHWDFTGSKLKSISCCNAIDFHVDPSVNNKQEIKDMYTGDNPERILIIIKTSSNVDTIYIWDMKGNV